MGKADITINMDTPCPVCPPEYTEYIKQISIKNRRAYIRAITPAGFAKAFFEANK